MVAYSENIILYKNIDIDVVFLSLLVECPQHIRKYDTCLILFT
jgi:hypothetical protein